MENKPDNGEENKLRTFQRLADVSLRTSATTLTIIFAYTFATEGVMSNTLKMFVSGVSVGLFFSIVLATFSLAGMSKGEIRYVKMLSVISIIIMVISLFFALMLLVSILWLPL